MSNYRIDIYIHSVRALVPIKNNAINIGLGNIFLGTFSRNRFMTWSRLQSFIVTNEIFVLAPVYFKLLHVTSRPIKTSFKLAVFFKLS